jgi:copper chaperone CopZ
MTKYTTMTVAMALVGAMMVGGCAGGGGAVTGTEGKPTEGVVHSVSEKDLAETNSRTALEGDEVTLWVNGLGCPQCATNIDKALENVPGVMSVQVDLGAGKVLIGLGGRSRPSPHDLSEAVKDAALTLVKIEK